jgi:hypothetical protein
MIFVNVAFNLARGVSTHSSIVCQRNKPIAHEGVGGGTAIVCHLMNIGYLTGKPFKWDPAKHEFGGGTCDPKFLIRDYRGEWKV